MTDWQTAWMAWLAPCTLLFQTKGHCPGRFFILEFLKYLYSACQVFILECYFLIFFHGQTTVSIISSQTRLMSSLPEFPQEQKCPHHPLNPPRSTSETFCSEMSTRLPIILPFPLPPPLVRLFKGCCTQNSIVQQARQRPTSPFCCSFCSSSALTA